MVGKRRMTGGKKEDDWWKKTGGKKEEDWWEKRRLIGGYKGG